MSGASYQGLFRNPMVSGDILGASAGAGFGAVIAMLFSLSPIEIQVSSFVFGLGAVALSYGISSKIGRGNSPVLVLVLTGMIVTALFTSAISLIKYVADPDGKLPVITFWLMGGLSSIKVSDLKIILFPLLAGIVPLLIFSRNSAWNFNLNDWGTVLYLSIIARKAGLGMKLEVRNVSCGYGTTVVLPDISFQADTGGILCLLEPNGVGKTTLFKTFLGFQKLLAGKILLDGENIENWPRNRLAKAVGYVPQAHTPPFPFTVLDVVVMGRTAHLGMFASPGKKDMELAEEALEALNVSYLKSKIYTEISGGERQRVLIARALAQQSQILIMDEPTSNLDFGNQIRVLEQIISLSKKGLTVIMTSHFPDHAFLCSTKVVLLQRNGIYLEGPAREVMTEGNLKAAYGVDVKIANVENRFGETINTCVPLLR